MRLPAIAKAMLVGAIAAVFAACQTSKAVTTAVSRAQSVVDGEKARLEYERLWRQPVDVEQNLRAAGQKQGVNGVREQKSRNGTLLKTLKGHTLPVNGVSFSPDGQTLASGSWDNTIKMWKRDGKLLKTLKGHTAPVTSVRFSPNGQILVSGSGDTNIRDNSFLKEILE